MPTRSSGLWELFYVGDRPSTDGQLHRFEHLVVATAAASPAGPSPDVS
jgi:hypothetical protein